MFAWGPMPARTRTTVHLRLEDAAGNTLAAREMDASRLVDRSFVALELEAPWPGSAGQELTLRVSAPDACDGNEIPRVADPVRGGGAPDRRNAAARAVVVVFGPSRRRRWLRHESARDELGSRWSRRWRGRRFARWRWRARLGAGRPYGDPTRARREHARAGARSHAGRRADGAGAGEVDRRE